MKQLPLYFAALALAVCGQAGATVYVDATGAGGAYTTINAALATADTDIVVKNTGVYEESLLITRSVTIRGEDPNNRPIIAVNQLSSQPACLGVGGAEYDGIYVGGNGSSAGNLDIAIKNLIMIPTVTGTKPSDDCLTGTADPGTTLNFTIENVLIAPNNGSNQPAAVSVWDNPDLGAVTRFNDDGIFFADSEFQGLDGTSNHHYTDLTIIGAGGDAIVNITGDSDAAITYERVGLSHSGRYGIQLRERTCDVTVTGTQEEPGLVIRKSGTFGLYLIRADQVNIDHAVIVENGTGQRSDYDSVGELTITNSLYAGNINEGIWTDWGAEYVKTWNIKNTTFFNNGSGSVPSYRASVNTNGDATVVFTDCIFAGAGCIGMDVAGAGTTNLRTENCALVTEGPNGLATISNGATITHNNQINSDPGFASLDIDPISATSFDVTNTAYATASSTSGELNGWGDGPGASVRDWSVY